MKKIIRTATIAAVLSLLSGCATTGDTGTNVLVRVGVAEFIAGDADTAESVVHFAGDVLELLEGNPKLLIDQVQEYAQSKIPWERLSPGQRIIAAELLTVVEARLVDGVTSGELPPNAVIRLRALFEVAEQQARIELRLAQQ